jgi:hypothetical protein
MTTTTDTPVLSKEDMSYLRRASDVYAINIDGQNYLRCVKRAKFDDAFDTDKRVDIPVAGNGREGWFTPAWEFPWHTLRAGDSVRFEWYPDAHRNDVLRDVGYHADVLYVHIRRGKTQARYIAATQVGPENSARMCREFVPASFE